MALNNLVLDDSVATDTRTFKPTLKDGPLVNYHETSLTPAGKWPKLSLGIREAKAGSPRKVTVKFTVPEEVTMADGTKKYVDSTIFITAIASEYASATSLADLRIFAWDILSKNEFIDAFEKGEFVN